MKNANLKKANSNKKKKEDNEWEIIRRPTAGERSR
jgi:hypothetical protein